MAGTLSASQGGRERSNYQPSKLPATQRGLPRSCHLWQQPLLCGQHLCYPPANEWGCFHHSALCWRGPPSTTQTARIKPRSSFSAISRALWRDRAKDYQSQHSHLQSVENQLLGSHLANAHLPAESTKPAISKCSTAALRASWELGLLSCPMGNSSALSIHGWLILPQETAKAELHSMLRSFILCS